jgi:ubiquinone/menaquinone biosynthesis C-methylase UbiE
MNGFCVTAGCRNLQRGEYFNAVGLRPGWTCLDIGCGPGAVMQVMGELAGPSGEVTGIDRDAKAGREAVERLQATGTSRYRFIWLDEAVPH